MRRNFSPIVLVILAVAVLNPGARAASREQQEMQRDIAQLQDSVRALQSSTDMKLAAIQTLIEQALDAGNKANTNVSVLSERIGQTLDRELKDALRPIAGLGSKLDNVNNDVSDLKSQMQDLTTQLNRQQTLLNDINNQIKILQAPPAAPPSSNINPNSAGRLPSAEDMFNGARGDFNSKPELAADEFAAFLKAYPDDAHAPDAQFAIGQIHLALLKYDQAVDDFDAVLERYPDNKLTPDSYFMKGMALKGAHRNDAAKIEFQNVVKKFPRSDQAPLATAQLHALGAIPATPVRKKK